MTSSAALPALSPDQVLPLLRQRQGEWQVLLICQYALPGVLSAIRSIEQQAHEAAGAMATSAEIRQLVAVDGSAICGQCVRPGKVAQTGETCGMQAEQMELGV